MMRARKPERVMWKPNKKCDRELEWCESCECGVSKDKTSLDVHFSSKSHKRKEALYMLASFFARHGLDYFPVGTSYFCSVCCMDLSNSVEALQYHLEKYADKHAIVVRVPPIAFSSTGDEVLVRKMVRLVDFATTNDALNEQFLKILK